MTRREVAGLPDEPADRCTNRVDNVPPVPVAPGTRATALGVGAVARSPVVVGRATELATVTAPRRRGRRPAVGVRSWSSGRPGSARPACSTRSPPAPRSAVCRCCRVARSRAGARSERSPALCSCSTTPRHATLPALRPYRAALGRLLPSWAELADDYNGPRTSTRSSCSPRACCGCCGSRSARHRPACCGWRTCTGPTTTRSRSSSTSPSARRRLTSAPGLLGTRRRPCPRGPAARRRARRRHACGLARLGRARGRRPGRGVPGRPARCRDEEARRLRERSDGLPFAVEELLAAPGATVPPTLAALVADRLGRARRPRPRRAARRRRARPGARLAAPRPRDRHPPSPRCCVRCGPRPGRRCSWPTASALRWPHALTRDAVLAALLPPERAALAGRAARVLAARAGPDDEPRAAELFVEAGEPDAAVALLLRLARRDAARGALRSAEQLLATAAAAAAGTAVAATVAAERVARAHPRRAGRRCAGPRRGTPRRAARRRPCRAVPAARPYRGRGGRVGRRRRPTSTGPDAPTTRARSCCAPTPRSVRAGVADASELAARPRSRGPSRSVTSTGPTSRRPRCARPSACAARLAWRTDLDVTECARRARRPGGGASTACSPWRVSALFELGMMRMLRADDWRRCCTSRELALDAGMLGQVAAIDFVHSDYLWLVDGPRAALPDPRAPRTTSSACCARPGMPSARGRWSSARRARRPRRGPAPRRSGPAAGPRPSRPSRAAARALEFDAARR